MTVKEFKIVGNQIKMYFKCPFCMTTYTIKVPHTKEKEEYLKGESKNVIQDVFTTEHETIRESILSGMCSHCQKVFFD